ncbi:Mycolic acid cyclopropane synthetase-domain-containing protein [Filobasidium floriforme]|uniref:Mycolic acid cyclopropane synthetase-domain-containing protein n=1 Tax=Filobasidium floriforme TaxID=5210 RepID=UPI001E8D9666|nr:Mycolic acid cyclopropane synthetase-domain-containing protein [Filobasidium floriforme]KAH8081430.1 Mycolic acid cyclopropane synthetase-domain-containing protein [Filobasidium floriforme]
MTVLSTLTSPLTSGLHLAQGVGNGAVNLAKDTIVLVGGTVAGNPVVGKVLEKGLIRVMQKQVQYGQLTLVLPSNKTYTFGPSPRPSKNTASTIAINENQTSRRTGKYEYPISSGSSSRGGEDSQFGTQTNGTQSGVSTPPTSVDEGFRGKGSRLDLVGSFSVGDEGVREEDQPVPVTIRVKSSTFFLRLLLSGDLGFAEAYMAGECDIYYTGSEAEVEVTMAGITIDDGDVKGQRLDEGYYGNAVVDGLKGVREGEELLELFKIAIRSDHPASTSSYAYHLAHPNASSSSRGITGGLNSLPATIFSTIGNYTTNSSVVNSVRNSVGNIRAHYDISNRMFASFLSADMTYSCAIFPTLDGDLSSSLENNEFNPIYQPDSYPSEASHATTDALETAQYAKLHHIIRKAKIRRGHRVLEIGSGWGSMAIEAVRLTGCTVDTLTLSTQQKVLAEERIRKAGLQDSIKVHLMDFRSIPESWKHSFDRLVSVEMLEAVGKEYIEPYFKMIDEVLNESGVAVFQVITIPESRFENYSNNADFIQKWIFPGGFLPSVAYTSEMISKGSQNRLTIDSIVNIGPHYARTLREWRLRFLKNFDRDIRPALRDEHPEMSPADVEVFKRKWIYYFVYCEIGFAERLIGDHIFSLSREGNRAFGSDVYA